MNRSTLLIIAALATTLAATVPASAASCPSGIPICRATPGSLVCSADASRQCLVNADCAPSGGTCVAGPLAIGGTAAPNGSAIASVVLTGATNLTLSPVTPGSPTYFRVFQTNTGLDASGTVLATDTLGHTCTVPVNFKLRAAGPIAPATPETICTLAENYSFNVNSAPSSPAGTTACSSHLATCVDTDPAVPSGYQYTSDGHILSIRSPISGVGVQMEMTRQGSFVSTLRLLFSRSADGGVTFSPFADVTTATLPGSTIIRGTGQWSDVKVVAGEVIPSVPTIGEWGVVILSLLLLSASSVLFGARAAAPAGAGGRGRLAVASAFDGPLLGKALAVAGVSWLLAAAAITAWRGAPTPADLAGSFVTMGILAYQAHLWILQRRR